MASFKTKDLENALTSKGFKKVKTHHEMYWLYCNGKKTHIRTRISHSEKEYGDNLLSQMAKQTKLHRSEFLDLVECPLSEEEYLKKLIQRGIIIVSRNN
ncbi:hypothetical protein KKC97_13685 [bacterium]|nr:hypothetical protein [bacterium]MBU1638709.1 hypothetical protein [bacterium]MBU1920630.1 hypothetical protein [bacterium]